MSEVTGINEETIMLMEAFFFSMTALYQPDPHRSLIGLLDSLISTS